MTFSVTEDLVNLSSILIWKRAFVFVVSEDDLILLYFLLYKLLINEPLFIKYPSFPPYFSF